MLKDTTRFSIHFDPFSLYQIYRCMNRLRNDLLYFNWDVQPY